MHKERKKVKAMFSLQDRATVWKPIIASYHSRKEHVPNVQNLPYLEQRLTADEAGICVLCEGIPQGAFSLEYK